MRKVVLSSCLVALGITTPISKIVADTYYVTPFLGYQVYESRRNMASTTLPGISFEAALGQRFGVEIAAMTGGGGYDRDGFPDIDISSARIDALWYLPGTTIIRPYVSAGYNYLHFEYEYPEGRDYEENQFDVGGGIRFALTDKLLLRTDLRLFSGRPKDGKQEITENIDGMFSIGLSFAFGSPTIKKTKLTQSNNDQDLDGIPNNLDVCPDNITYTHVDEKGCPLKKELIREITLSIGFPESSTEVMVGETDQLRRLAEYMKKHTSVLIEVQVHTDDSESVEISEELSQQRAETIARMLTDGNGIDPDRIVAIGYGSRKPVASNDTLEGRSKNNRVVVVLEREISSLTDEDEPHKQFKKELIRAVTLGITFPENSAAMLEDAPDQVSKLAEYLQHYPSVTVEIQAHTDNLANDDFNKALSEHRAKLVANILISQYGIDPSRVAAKGYGAENPVAPNNTPEGRERNNRVVAVLERTIQQ